MKPKLKKENGKWVCSYPNVKAYGYGDTLEAAYASWKKLINSQISQSRWFDPKYDFIP